jgi:hypothetical protein
MNYSVQLLCLCGFKGLSVDEHNGIMVLKKEGRKGGACGMNAGEEKSMQDCGEICRKETIYGT